VTRLVPCRFAHFIAAMPAFGASAYPQLYAPRQSWPRALTGYRSRLAVSSVVSLVTAVLWPARQAASIADDWSAGTDPGDRHIMDFAAGARGGAGRRRFDDAQPLGDEDRLIGSCAGGPRASRSRRDADLHRGPPATKTKPLHLPVGSAWLGGLVACPRRPHGQRPRVSCRQSDAARRLGRRGGWQTAVVGASDGRLSDLHFLYCSANWRSSSAPQRPPGPARRTKMRRNPPCRRRPRGAVKPAWGGAPSGGRSASSPRR
jgi:hypothetical protein